MKPIKIIFSFILGLGLAMGGRDALAGELVGPRKIVDLGCHNMDGTCFVTLAGDAFGATQGCVSALSNDFRFDNGDTAVGKRSYASLLAAFLSGKSVTVYLEGCTAQGVAKLAWFHISG